MLSPFTTFYYLLLCIGNLTVVVSQLLIFLQTSQTSSVAQSVLRKAEDVISGMLAMGFILGKDALNKARSFDEKHQLTRTTSVKVASFDQKVGLTEKISAGATIVSDKVREVDQRFQVSEKTKSVFAAAEQRVSNAGSAVMTNRYILTGASWVAGAFSKVSEAAGEAAGEVGRKTKEKVEDAEEQQNRKLEAHYAQVLADTPKADSEDIELLSPKPAPAPAPAQGLIL
ncbi:hypothetical protein Fmac_002914 [Flemingia macrophylla]|uniref:Uncharacterized protein n=1 Tax=Flemingia macrophylla TaxID=520843 RepID=A0ABD1NLA0_9FABA